MKTKTSFQPGILVAGIIILSAMLSASAQVSINNDNSLPDVSSMLDVKSTSKGLLVPRMSLSQRNAITSPANWLILFQTDNTPGLYYNSGTPSLPSWNLVGNNAGQWSNNGTSIYYNAGNVGIGTTSPTEKLHVNGGDALINGLTIGRGEGSAATNTALGSHTLFYNTTGNYNTAAGYYSLYYNKESDYNTATGYYALYYDTTGSYNTATGGSALYNNRSGAGNTAGGYRALYTNSTGDYNTASGYRALYTNTAGNNNTAYGERSLYSNETGYSNVAVGIRALYRNTERSNLVAIGDSALYNNGLNAFEQVHSSHNTAVGSKALYANTTGYANTTLGYMALNSNTTGYLNYAGGYEALFSNISGSHNTAIGERTLYANTSGERNTAVGKMVLYKNTTASGNTAIGSEALNDNITGGYNTAVGYRALEYNITGEHNTAVGSYAGAGSYLENIDYGTFIGYDAHTYSVDSILNVTALGSNSRPTNGNQVRIGNSAVNSIGGYAGWTNLSDERYKTNVKENVAGLDFIMKLRPVTYHLDAHKLAADLGEDQKRDDDGSMRSVTPSESEIKSRDEKAAITYTGFIAQEVESVAKIIGYDFSGVDAPKNEKSFYGLRYAEFVVPLVKAVQEQQEIIESQQKQIEELMQRVGELEKR